MVSAALTCPFVGTVLAAACSFPKEHGPDLKRPPSTPRSGPPVRSNAMRWFAAALVILVLVALDRAYIGGQNLDLLLSLARRVAAAINNWADDLIGSVRRG